MTGCADGKEVPAPPSLSHRQWQPLWLPASCLLATAGTNVWSLSPHPPLRGCVLTWQYKTEQQESKIISELHSNERISAMIAHRRAGLCCQPSVALSHHCQRRHLDPAQPALPELPARVPKDAPVLVWQDTSVKIQHHLAKNKNGPVSKEKYPSPFQKPTKHTAARQRCKEHFWESSCWAQCSFQINRRLCRSTQPTLTWKAGTRHYPLPSSFVSWC